MSQNDFDIANGTGSVVRAELNNQLKALASQSSGTTAPSTMFANQIWYDTTNNIVKMRNEANDAWINLWYLDQAVDKLERLYIGVDGTAINAAGSINFGATATDSAIYFNGTNLEVDSATGIDLSVAGVAIGVISTAGFNLPSTGDSFSIGGVAKLSNTALGSTVVSSSLISLGTVTTGTWNATDIAVPDGGTGRGTGGVAYAVICAGTTATGAQQNVAALGSSGEVLTSNGAGALPSWQAGGGGVAHSVEDGVGNTILFPITFTRTTSTTPAIGIGVGIEFEVETSAANNELGGLISAVTTAVGAGAEEFDFVFSTMTGGAIATEGFRIDANNGVTIPTGDAYRINDVDTLNATTLGSAVVNSSITSVGTIGTGVWEATDVGVSFGGTGRSTGGVAYSVLCVGTTATGVQQNVGALGSSGDVLTSNGAGALPSWTAPSVGTQIIELNTSVVVTDSGSDGTITATTDGVTAWVTDNAQDTDFQANNVTTGGIIRIDIDGTAINAAGSLNFGLTATDSAIYWNGTNLEIDSSTEVDISVSGTPILNVSVAGADLISTGDSYQIGGVDKLSNTVLGSAVVTSSLTTVGTIGTGIWQATDVGVVHGGTGRSTGTIAYGVICVGTTATGVQQTVSGLGSTNQVLTSNGAGTLPTWQDVAAGDHSAEDGAGNTVLYPTKFTRTTTTTPAIGIGVGLQFEIETAASENLEIGATIEVEAQGVGSGAENFDMIFYTMSGGATATEAFKIDANNGVSIPTGDSYQVNDSVVINSNSLGTSVVNSSLTSVGTLGTLSVTGTITGPSGTWDSGGMDIATGDTYAINGVDKLTATALGTAVVSSSLTSVGALSSGAITAGFGNIDIGTTNDFFGGKMTLQDADSTTNTIIDVLTVRIDSNGTPTSGIGVAIALGVETAVGNIERGCVIEAFPTALTDGAEEFDFIFKTMTGGATANEAFRIDSNNGVTVPGGLSYRIAGTSVLNSTTLGSGISGSSLTAVGALTNGSIAGGFGNINLTGATTLDVAGTVTFNGTTNLTGTINGPSGSWDSGGMDIATGDTYAINGANVFDNAITLSSGVVNSSLTSVGTITSGTWNGTDIGVTDGGTGRGTGGVAYAVLCAGTTATGVQQNVAALGSSGDVLTSGGAGVLPTFQAPGAGTTISQLNSSVAVTDTGTDGTITATTDGTTAWVTNNSQDTDFQANDIITGGIINLDVDGTAINAAGSVTFGFGNDASIYWNGSNLEFDTTVGIDFSKSGTPFTAVDTNGDWDFLDNKIQKPELLDYSESVNAIGGTGGGTQDIDLKLGNTVTATVDTSANTFTFTDPSPSGTACNFTFIITNGGSQAVNWPASVDWAGGTAPTLTTTGRDVLTFMTVDGGTIWYGFAAGLNFS